MYTAFKGVLSKNVSANGGYSRTQSPTQGPILTTHGIMLSWKRSVLVNCWVRGLSNSMAEETGGKIQIQIQIAAVTEYYFHYLETHKIFQRCWTLITLRAECLTVTALTAYRVKLTTNMPPAPARTAERCRLLTCLACKSRWKTKKSRSIDTQTHTEKKMSGDILSETSSLD